MGVLLKLFCILTLTVNFKHSQAAKLQYERNAAFPPTALQEVKSRDIKQFQESPLEVYKPNFSSALEEGCAIDCESEIFCHGELLHDIQMAHLYPDSKTFVDKKLVHSEKETVAKYRALKEETKGQLTTDHLKKFIDENFADDTFEPWVPSDWKEVPNIVNRVEDEAYRKWVSELNHIWKDLAMKLPDEVKEHPDRHSYLYVPNGFIRVGGRFQEMYYSDTYWTVRGLLLSDMPDTVRGIIENMVWLVKEHGHVPNANRKYYLQRSHPPLLIQAAATYHSSTKDDKFIEDNLQYFVKEFHYWYDNRMTEVHKDGETYLLARYDAVSCTPRPESYYEDFVLTANVTNELERKKIFTALKSAAESTWDFSSRHFRAKDGTNKGTLIDMDPQDMVYVDLNCFLHANAVVLSEWFKLFGNEDKSQYYRNIANKLFIAIEKVFWNDEVGVWLDYDTILKQHRNYFFPSNLTPLWTRSYQLKNMSYVEKVINYLQKEKIIKLDLTPTYFGIPASKDDTHEQWDFPNCWAPLQSIVIQGLERSLHPVARYIAFKLAQTWIHTTHAVFLKEGHMFEKYSAIESGTIGGGGEYVTQIGFGWTNGFCIELFNTWGMYFKSENTSTTS